MINQTYLEVQVWASSFLEENNQEAEIAYHLLLDLADFSVSDWVLKRKHIMPTDLKEAYQAAIEKVAKENYPWQYIVGRAWFYGETFKVSPATLIPRQETEDLVTFVADLIKKGHIAQDARVIDIGTGTGIIAITLKQRFPNLQVTATDISPDALDIARENAADKEAVIDFQLGDLFEPVLGQEFDLIISNPPYISSDETDVMSKSTVLYEPDLALFAEENGYQIYWRLFDQIHDYLAKPGYFIGEFGYQQGQSLLAGAKDRLRMTDAEVNIIQDYAGNDRILVIQNPYNTTI